MSGKAVGWAYEQHCGSPITKGVLVKLADNANDLGIAFPSLNKIVEQTELSKRTVIDHLEKLADPAGLNLIEIERNEIHGQHIVNRYRLKIPGLDAPKTKAARQMHHKVLDQPRAIVPEPAPANNPSPECINVGSVGATPLVQPTHDGVVSQPHEGSVADAGGSVADAGGSVAGANPPAPPIKINPQSNPQTEPTQNAGARASDEPPEFLRRYPPEFEQFVAAWPTSDHGKDEIFAVWRLIKPPVPNMLDAVGLYRADVEAQNAKRPADNQRPWMQAMSWLRNRRWEGYLAKAERAAELARSQPLQERPWGMHPAGAKLLSELGAGEFDAWLRPCVLSVHEGQPMLTAPSRLIRDRVATHYLDQIERAFGCAVGIQ